MCSYSAECRIGFFLDSSIQDNLNIEYLRMSWEFTIYSEDQDELSFAKVERDWDIYQLWS